MAMFRVGDKVKERYSGTFGKKGVGRVTKASRDPFLHYNVKYRGSSEIYEYHRGELKSHTSK